MNDFLFAVFTAPFVFVFRHSHSVFFACLAVNQVCWAFGGAWPRWIGTSSAVAAVTVASLGLGAALERAGARQGRYGLRRHRA